MIEERGASLEAREECRDSDPKSIYQLIKTIYSSTLGERGAAALESATGTEDTRGGYGNQENDHEESKHKVHTNTSTHFYDAIEGGEMGPTLGGSILLRNVCICTISRRSPGETGSRGRRLRGRSERLLSPVGAAAIAEVRGF
jgi:hypothetical protein